MQTLDATYRIQEKRWAIGTDGERERERERERDTVVFFPVCNK